MAETHLEREAREWIEEIVGIKFDASFADSLKDGAILCRLVQTIYGMAGRPVTFKINEPATFKPVSMASKKRENITNAITAIRALGMKEFEMFGTVDLYEEKNIPQVVNCIHALGRLMQSATFASLGLPKLGVKVQEKNTRTFSEAQIAQARSAVSLMSLGSSKYGTQAMSEVLEGKAATIQMTASPSVSTPSKARAADASGSAASASKPASHAASGAAPVASPSASPATADSAESATVVPVSTSIAASAVTPAKIVEAESSTDVTPAATSSDTSSALPADWQELTTEAGLVYYYNEAQGITSWDRPGAPGSTVPAELPAGWQELLTPEGRAYYYEEATGTTSWDRPAPATTSAAAGVSPAAADATLPPGWQMLTTADGQAYYVEAATGTTQWERPGATGSALPPLPAGWEELSAGDGLVYYVETATGTTQWERPS